MNEEASMPVYMSMSSTMAVQSASAGESIKKKHPGLLQQFATPFVRFNAFRHGKR